MRLTIRHVVAQHRVVDAIVTDDRDHAHRIGHLPTEGWFCACAAGKRCRLIPTVRDVVTPMELT